MLQELRKPSNELLALWSDQDREGELEEFVSPDAPLATWWVQMTPGTTYWRANVPAKHLPGDALRLKYADLKEDAEGRVIVPRQRGNTAIWQFVGVAVRALIMAHQQDQGLRVLMELDDSYLHAPPIPPLPGVIREWGTRIDRENAAEYSYPAHRKIIRWCDGLIVSTEELASRYAQRTQAPIYHCPNSVDLDDWPGHSEGWGRSRTSDSDALAIGYAGSGSHRYDIALIERGMDWAWRQPNVKLKMLGQSSGDRYPHENIPWSDNLADYRRNLQVLDVGLCPLKRSDWHDCKSDIKAMEYLLAGAVPIVQRDSPCYRDWVDVVPSATTEKDWLRQIKWAVQSPREELQDAWQRGYDFLLKNKLISQHISKWRRAVQ
jgi:hypothetical protein